MGESKETGKAHLQTTGYFGSFVVLGMVVASLGPTLPGLAENTQTLLSEISFLFTTRSLGYLFGSFVGGRVYDRVPGHPVMATVLLVIATTMALAPLITLLWLLAVAMLILGLAEGALDVGGNTLMVWVHRDRVGPFMNGLHFFFGVGAFLSPILIARAMLVGGGITRAYWGLAVLMLPVALWLLRLPSPFAQSISRQRNQGFSSIARQGAGYRTPVSDGRLLVALIALFLFFYVGAEVSFGGWIFTYAVTLDLSGETAAAYLTSAFWGALTLGRLLSIPTAVRVRPLFILLGDLAGCLAFVGIILLWPNTSIAIWSGAIGLGFAMASIFPTTLSLAERRMKITGRVTGWFFVGASAGGMSLPWLIGQLFESIGPRVMMFVIMVDLIVAMSAFVALTLYSTRFETNDDPRRPANCAR